MIFQYIKLIDKNILEVGAATLDRKVANFAKENNLKRFRIFIMYTRINWWCNKNE